VARARALAAAGEPDRAATAYTRALSLWRGRPLTEVDGWLPGRSEAARLEELKRTVEEDLLDARLAAGEHRLVAVEAERSVTEDPLRERRWAMLAVAQYRCGRQADALRSLRTARRTLAEELGLDPGPELVELEQAILRQDPTLATVPEPAHARDECPYKGLAPYDVDDTESFFGREAEIAACLDRLRSAPLLVVAGPSGCGKSSLVRAGLVPALRGTGRSVAVFTPGRDPEAALLEAVASVESPGVLVVDQFEELLALGTPPDVVRAFCHRLAEHGRDRAPVVIAVRSDHLSGLGVDEAFSRLAERGLHLVSPLAGDALRAAIEQPAALAWLRLEDGLVDLLVRDSEGEPGALPLLSHALAETWRRRDGHVLTVEGYRATGGIRGAVARSADRLYENLPPEQRAMLRSVLLRLVTPSLDGDPVRCRVPSRSLLSDPGRERVVALLMRARLVTADENSVELAHEALARAWPRLQTWLEDDAAGQRILRHLGTAANEWDSLGRPDHELYRGARLDTALEWRDSTHPDLTDLEVAFLEASADRAASESLALADRARRDARQNRRLRSLLTATAILLVVSIVAGLVAVLGRQEAARQRDAARDAQESAQLEALVNQSLALRATNRSVAALLAVEAFERRPDARAWSALLGTFTAAPRFLGHRYLPAEHLSGAVVPGTTKAVVALDGRDLTLLDLSTGELTKPFPPADENAEPYSIVRVSEDGRFAAQLVLTTNPAGCFNLERLQNTDDRGCAAFSVYEIASGRRTLGPVSTPFGPGDIAINADGSLIAVAGGFDGDVAVYRTSDGRQLGVAQGVPRPEGVEWVRDTAAVAFGPDRRLYLGSMAGPIRELDTVTLDVMRTLDAPPQSSNNHLVTTASGVIVGGGPHALVEIDTGTGMVRWTADLRTGIHPDPCPWLAVAEAAGTLYCGNYYGVIDERDLATGQNTDVVFDPQLGSVGDLAVTDRGELVAFGDEYPAVSRWRLDGGGMVTDLVAEGHVLFDGYDPTGETMLVARRNPVATIDAEFQDFAIWDPAADQPLDTIDESWFGLGWVGYGTLTGYSRADDRIAFYDADAQAPADGVVIPLTSNHGWPSAGGTRFYAGFTEEIWTIDPETRERIEPTLRVDGTPMSVSATRDGERIVVTTDGPSGPVTTVHDGRTGERIGGELYGPEITSVSLDGLLVGASSGDITQYDLETLKPIAKFAGARGEVSTLQFSRDGRILVATSNDQTVSVYDVATRIRLGDPIPTAAPLIYPGFLRPDGGAVAITARDGVAVWDIEPSHLADAACTLAGRNLTETEWDTYLSDLGDYRTTCPAFSPEAPGS
jgi:WD40 repeat protein